MSLLAAFGMLLAIMFLGINVHFRCHRFIKMSSPNMNNLIIVGSILTYLSVILLGLDTRIISENYIVVFCYAKIWVLSIGFTLAFGSMFSKTWRVHSIFTNIRMNKKAITDYKLLLIVAIILLIDALIFLVWVIFSPLSFIITYLPSIHRPEKNQRIVPEIEKCQCSHAILLKIVLYSVKGLLMILGCLLAWETRHVKVPALNDSKYIGLCVYNVVVMCSLGLALSLVLQDRLDEAYGLTSFFILFCTTLTLCLVFVPKVFELIRNPKGTERKFRKDMMKSMVGGRLRKTTQDQKRAPSEREQLICMEHDNQKSSQVWDLMEQLRELHACMLMKGDEDKTISTSAGWDNFGGVYTGTTTKNRDKNIVKELDRQLSNTSDSNDAEALSLFQLPSTVPLTFQISHSSSDPAPNTIEIQSFIHVANDRIPHIDPGFSSIDDKLYEEFTIDKSDRQEFVAKPLDSCQRITTL